MQTEVRRAGRGTAGALRTVRVYGVPGHGSVTGLMLASVSVKVVPL
jgi:hypothetical protein